MILFLIIVSAWTIILFLIAPQPSNLRETINRWESFKEIKGTFLIGVVLCFVFFVLSGGSFYEISDDWLFLFAVNNVKVFTPWWLIQAFTHTLIHIDILHLLLNLFFLGFLSLYERRVGTKRFLAIFFFSGILSSVSVFFFSKPMMVAGSSAGLFGLFASYILDDPRMKLKEFIIAILFVVFIWVVIELQPRRNIPETYSIDRVGHLLGLFLGIIYCKLFARKHP